MPYSCRLNDEAELIYMVEARPSRTVMTLGLTIASSCILSGVNAFTFFISRSTSATNSKQ